MPMSNIDFKQYRDPDTFRLVPEHFDERIDEVREEREELESVGRRLSAAADAELFELLTFRSQVEGITPDRFDEAILVAEEDLINYLRHQAEEEFGLGPDNLGDYVDWERWAANRRAHGFAGRVGLAGTIVWVR